MENEKKSFYWNANRLGNQYEHHSICGTDGCFWR